MVREVAAPATDLPNVASAAMRLAEAIASSSINNGRGRSSTRESYICSVDDCTTVFNDHGGSVFDVAGIYFVIDRFNRTVISC
jgi:hypothetical protein